MSVLPPLSDERVAYAKRRLTEALNHCEVPRQVMRTDISWGHTSRARVYARMAQEVGGRPCTIREIAFVTGYSTVTVASSIRPVQATSAALWMRDRAMTMCNAPADLWTNKTRTTTVPDGRTYSEIRQQVWWTMRQPHGGHKLSLPEIAAATTGNGHSGVISGLRSYVQRKERAERAAKGQAQPMEVAV